MMHYADATKSNRLKKLLKCLKDAGRNGLTTRQIIQKAKVCAVSSCISELRCSGYEIDCWFRNKTESGEAVYLYRLRKE